MAAGSKPSVVYLQTPFIISCHGAGPLVTAAINLIDDAVFTVADVATGYQEADMAFANFGKSAVASVASAGIGVGADSLSGAMGSFGESAVGSTLMAGSEQFASNATTGAISALEYDGEWSFH